MRKTAMKRSYLGVLLGTALLVAACAESPTDSLGIGPISADFVPESGIIHMGNSLIPKCVEEDVTKQDEWHFLINGLDSAADAPASITVHFAVAGDVVVPFQKFTGGTAHYLLEGAAYLFDSLVSPGATAVMTPGTEYTNFNLSHGPCHQDAPEESTVVTQVHDAAHTEISDLIPADLATIAHDQATVTVLGVNPIPAGSTVTFNFYNNIACTGDPAFTSPAPHDATSGVVDDGLPQGPLGAGEYSYKADFTSGDETKVLSSAGACEPLKVNKGETTTSTNVHDALHNAITNTSVIVGTFIHDNATVGTAVEPFAITGTVTFSFFANGACTGDPVSAETVAVGDESTPQQINASGHYAYSAKYNGDANYEASSNSDCEPITIFQLGKSQGFWGNTNGIARITGAGGYAANAVAIGRSSNIDTQAEATKVLPSTSKACNKGAVIIFAGQTALLDCPINASLPNFNALNTLSSQTLALGYNIGIVSGYTGQAIGDMLCSAGTTGLSNSDSVNTVFTTAKSLIDGTAPLGSTTSSQIGAMNALMTCLNREV